VLDCLKLRDFRNYVRGEWFPAPGLNLVVGRNAQGKTNLLEAAYLLATGQLLRGQRDAEAIREGADSFRVDGDLDGGRATLSVTLERGGRKRALLNDVGFPRASDLMGRLPCVGFGASDLEIVRGEPEDRRRFIDLTLPQLRPAFLRSLAGYKRALEQRNRLLRQANERPIGAPEFEVWEAEMALYGSAVRQARAKWITELTGPAAKVCAHLSGGEDLQLVIDDRGEPDSIEGLAALWTERRPHDLQRGTTGQGPHRDELSMTVEGRPVRLFGSQGQQRTVAIALKLGTLTVMRETLGRPPLVLLDDVFAELDEGRRERLLAAAMGLAGQVILTCTEVEQAGAGILDSARVVRVEGGQLCQS